MSQNIDLLNMVSALRDEVSVLEAKMDELYMRPRMPYSQTGNVGDKLVLDANKQPEWSP